MLKGPSRGPGFIARVELEGLLHPGSGINAKVSTSDNRGAIRCEHTSAGTRDSRKGNRYYTCGNFGRLAKAFTMTDGSGYRRIISEKGLRV